MRFKDKVKQINEKMDVSKKLPKGYLNLNLIRIGWVLILVLWFIALASNNFSLSAYYAECPEAYISCANPFIQNLDYYQLNEFCESQPELCEPSIQGGQSIGHKANFLYINFNEIAFFLIILIYGLNHLLWRRKQ